MLLVGVDLGTPHFDAELVELGLLAQTAGLQSVARLVCKRSAPDAALFVGSGKAVEIAETARLHGATEVLFDQALSPAQQRNLERELGLPVNDRTYLILTIFAQRARSHEGKLQVELARLQYVSTRLVRRWSHLERQRGGIGARGGPGEAQIELDRRMIGESIKRIRERLQKVKRQRQTQRRRRERQQTFNISLVGYTNAGKSSLFNALVKARAYTADQLFATLDTTTRQLYLEDLGRTVSMSDTVGFIRDLPHGLVDAFEATLQEACGRRSAGPCGGRRQPESLGTNRRSAACPGRNRCRRRTAAAAVQQAGCVGARAPANQVGGPFRARRSAGLPRVRKRAHGRGAAGTACTTRCGCRPAQSTELALPLGATV